MLHTIYPLKSLISRYSYVDDSCSFCKSERELLNHLFFECKIVQNFWMGLAKFNYNLVKVNYIFTLKDIIVHYENKTNKCLEYIVNLFILLAKFYKQKKFK